MDLGTLAAIGAVLLMAIGWRRARRRRREGGTAEARSPRQTAEGERGRTEAGAGTARSGGAGAWAWYHRKKLWLLRRREKEFEVRLRQALREAGLQDWRVAVQVALSGVVDQRRGRADKHGMPHWRLDYVITDPEWAIQGVIELNDGSHATAARRRRDQALVEGLERLGIPVLAVESLDASGVVAWLNSRAEDRQKRLRRLGRGGGRPKGRR